MPTASLASILYATHARERGPECRVCSARPNSDGERIHGKGCYTLSEDGGGSDWPEMPTFESLDAEERGAWEKVAEAAQEYRRATCAHRGLQITGGDPRRTICNECGATLNEETAEQTSEAAALNAWLAANPGRAVEGGWHTADSGPTLAECREKFASVDFESFRSAAEKLATMAVGLPDVGNAEAVAEIIAAIKRMEDPRPITMLRIEREPVSPWLPAGTWANQGPRDAAAWAQGAVAIASMLCALMPEGSARDVAIGLAVLARHGDVEVSASHDEVYAGDTRIAELAADEIQTLTNAKWRWSTEFDCWARFV